MLKEKEIEKEGYFTRISTPFLYSKRQERWLKISRSSRRARGSGWLSRSPLEKICVSETEIACKLHSKPVRETYLLFYIFRIPCIQFYYSQHLPVLSSIFNFYTHHRCLVHDSCISESSGV